MQQDNIVNKFKYVLHLYCLLWLQTWGEELPGDSPGPHFLNQSIVRPGAIVERGIKQHEMNCFF